MDNTPTTEGQQPVSARLLWFSRIMGWLCWAGVAWTIVFVVLQMSRVLPRAPANSDGLIGYASVSFGVHDPTAARPPIPQELLNDPFYIASGLIAPALMIWALISARSVFANIGRGQFFARSTSLGLRNLSLAVLINMIVGPIANLAATLAFAFRMRNAGTHGEVYFDMGPSGATLLVLVFAATVMIVASVMAHAARVAAENEQFV